MSTCSPYRQCTPPSSIHNHKFAQKLSPSQHEGLLFGTLLLIAVAIIRMSAPGGFLLIEETTANMILWMGVTVYLLLAIPENELLMHLLNLTPIQQYQKVCTAQKYGQSRFCFSICCYKEEDSSSFFGDVFGEKFSSITRLVQTVLEPAKSQDDGRTAPILEEKSLYTIVNFLKGYELADEKSESSLELSFNQFVENNSVDTSQEFSCKFQIEGFQDSIGFGEGNWKIYLHVVLIFLFTFLGLAYPVCLWMEGLVKRYEVKLVKKVTM